MQTNKKAITAKKRRLGILSILLSITTGLFLLAMAPASWAEDEEEPFDEAHIFFELNNTDGDLGIHSLIDGDAWKRLEIEDPKERRMLNVNVRGRLRKQGLTEIFFESAEPPFESDDPDEVTLSPEKFFKRFPEGIYEIEGITLEGDELESEALLTHVMPAPPVVEVNGYPAAEDCDSDLPELSAPITLSWEPVTMSHDEIGRPGVDISDDIVNYEVVIEIDETPWKSSTILPPEATSFVVPEEILDLVEYGDEIKFEILVREASYNQTAVESCFVLVAP